jgi:thiol:disulfide interchange protein
MKTKIYGRTGKHWKPFTVEKLETALASGKLVLVDFTADWCVNCKVLEEFVLNSEAILTEIDRRDIVSLTADCTGEGEAKKFLRQYGADQVPVLMIFNPKEPAKPVILRGGYTQGTLLKLLLKP